MKRGCLLLFVTMVGVMGCGGDDTSPSAASWGTKFEGSTPWKLVSKQHGGRTLIVAYQTFVEAVPYPHPARNVRDRLQHVDVTETEDTVELGLDQIIQQRVDRRVGMLNMVVEVPIRLAKPLGSRRLVHAPTTRSPITLDPGPAGGAMVRLHGAGEGVSDPSLWDDSK